MKISVVTTTYNRPRHFRLFLAALAAQTRRPDEVVAADDGSGPEEWTDIQAAAEDSPLVNTGLDFVANGGVSLFDVVNNPRIWTKRVDIGAYELKYKPPAGHAIFFR